MKLKTLRNQFVNSLSILYDPEEVLSFFYILTEHFLGLSRVEIAMQLDKELTDLQLRDFEKSIHRLGKEKPIQYITGVTDFYGLRFAVNNNVLIPRPETEELVDWIVKDQELVGNKRLKILDIGTGSGCIAISLAKYLKGASVSAIDISDAAIHVAKENAVKNGVEVTFFQKNILKEESLEEKYDVIVSNPPYVREVEKQEMKANVLENEPHQALFVTNQKPLIFYKKITELAKKALHSDGKLYFEINQYLGKETVNMIKSHGFASVKLKQDIYQNDRMIKASNLLKNK